MDTQDWFTGRYRDPANFSPQTAAWVEENLNCVTGPISVAGAKPGDAIEIHIEPGRDAGRLPLLRRLQGCEYGRIVLTSSITGSVVGQPGYAHYGASKAAMLGLMRSAALELAPTGVTINAVLPGNIRTPGFAELGAEHERRMLAAIPAHRFGEPEDVGWAVRFLASREAGYITGQTLIVDGGQVLPESML